MLKTHFRPRLDTLEDRVPPSDAMFSLLLEPMALLDLGAATTRVALDRPGHCGDGSSGQLGLELSAVQPKESGLDPLAGLEQAPVVAPAPTSALTVAVVQSIGDDPSIQSITVNFGVLPKSTFHIPRLDARFGNDPPKYGLDVDIDKETWEAVVPADRLNLNFTVRFSGITIDITSFAYEDGSGYYDFGTGAGMVSAVIGFHATNPGGELPGFDNDNCILYPIAINLSTDRPGGVNFSGGDGTMVDNELTIPALELGSCGSGPFGDYAEIFNDVAGLPVKNPGQAILTLNLRQDPPQSP